jgi:carbon-monoxide dehydrogenase small subunit
MKVNELNITAEIDVKFRLNGKKFEKSVPVGWTLLRYLRDGLGYTGTKCGCEIGECGVCTIILNGQAVNSCLVLASQINDVDIWTIEGIAESEANLLHPVQQAYIDCDSVHCGFCSPGMIISTIALLMENKSPDSKAIKSALAGNLCRCTGYARIIDAVKKAASNITKKDLKKFRSSN